ncbi:MAG: hypothetical protein RLZZ175_455 [Bacteroidota bacterium]|jgi:hypothetical protein
MTRKYIHKIIIFITLLTSYQLVNAQGKDKIIQLSGVVVNGDSAYGVLGTHIYVPKSGRGATTNQVGFFSLPVIAGDSLIISAIGYQRQHYVVAKNEIRDNISIMISLQPDTSLIPVVEVFPYYTEELFKQAFLALRLPDNQSQTLAYQNISDRIMYTLYQRSEMDGSMNHTYFMQQQSYAQSNRYSPPQITLLNPFAWSQFIKSLKNGDFKKKEFDENGKRVK